MALAPRLFLSVCRPARVPLSAQGRRFGGWRGRRASQAVRRRALGQAGCWEGSQERKTLAREKAPVGPFPLPGRACALCASRNPTGCRQQTCQGPSTASPARPRLLEVEGAVVQRLVVVGLVDLGPHPVHRLLHLAPARPRARGCASAGTAQPAHTPRAPMLLCSPPLGDALRSARESAGTAHARRGQRAATVLSKRSFAQHTRPPCSLERGGTVQLRAARMQASTGAPGCRPARRARSERRGRERRGAPHHSSSFCVSRARMTGTATAGFFFSRSTTWCPASPAHARLRVSARKPGPLRPLRAVARPSEAAPPCASTASSQAGQSMRFSAGPGRRVHTGSAWRGCSGTRSAGAGRGPDGHGRAGRLGAGAAVRYPGWRRRCAGWRGSGWATACPPAAASSPSPPPPAPAPARGGVSTRRPNLEHAKQSGGQQHAC